jgi:hypothetical protein
MLCVNANGAVEVMKEIVLQPIGKVTIAVKCAKPQRKLIRRQMGNYQKLSLQIAGKV